MDGLIKFVLICVAVVAVIYAIFIAIAVAAFTAMLLAGLISVYIVKSGAKTLVQTQQGLGAFILSLGWASVLTTGCILGSFALFWALAMSEGQAFGQHMEQRYGEVYDFRGLILALDNWLLVGAYAFFFKTTAALYLANRIFIARKSGGDAWLGIIPPIGAMFIFFLAEHWELVLNALASRPHLERLGQELWAVIMLPVDLAVQAIRNPDAVIQWGVKKFKESDGSMFKLAALFPTIFWIIAVAFGLRALTGTAEVVSSS
jgi:hypothetical protein